MTMRPWHPLCVAVALGWLAACSTTPAPRASNADLVRQVAEAERAFAKTMADRDHAAFATFVSEEAVFFTGPVRNPSGKQVATFSSTWRLEAPGTWRVVFDSGNDICDCAAKPGG